MLAGSNLRAMRSRRLLAVPTLAATALAGATFCGTASAGDGDRDVDKNVLLAEAQFQLFLVTSDFVPSDVTCTRPPVRDAAGELLCYALVSDRVSVAAVATMESPGVYAFTPLNKVDPAELARAEPTVDEPTAPEQPAPESPTSSEPDTDEPAGATDQAIVASLNTAADDAVGLGRVLTENNSSISSLDSIAYHEPTSTLQVAVTTNVTDSAARDSIAFYVTDVMAYLWMDSEPTREADATIHPRLEVTVDDVLYGTPFDVMVDVADYAITEPEWLEIVTGIAAAKSPQSAERAASRAAHRVAAKVTDKTVAASLQRAGYGAI
ncbi:MAG: hypothetical protein K0S92_1654 [Desertimonas sp.]|nr:hypothetical protein [Desertimonas sp.]